MTQGFGMTRREALKAFGTAMAATTLQPRTLFAEAQKKGYNVLFVAVDDLNTELGCYGNELVKSPNIDRLAARGLRFDRAYCQAPICGPTRASIFTGFRPDTSGVYDNYTHFREKLRDAVTLPAFFKKHGYTTVHYGKIFHGGKKDPSAWSDWAPQGRPRLPSISKEEREYVSTLEPGERMMRCAPLDEPDAACRDGRNARLAAHAIEELQDRPFFMGLGFAKPHVPLIAPRKYFEMYDPADIELRRGPKVRGNYNRYLRPHFKRDLTDDDAREIIRAYYACTTFIDAQLGLVLDTLDRLKLTDKTIVVFWGDHGWLLGQHWRWAKHCLYEEVCRVPLIFAGPGIEHPGRPSERLVECVDVYPTLAELCGLTPPAGLEGLSLVPLMRDPDRPWKTFAITQHKSGEVLGTSIRTDRYRYTEWRGTDKVELYDHEKDPYEYDNVADDPAYAETVRELHRLLEAGWRAALPSA